jgi:hypothetical protein
MRNNSKLMPDGTMPSKPRISGKPVFVDGRTSSKSYLVVATRADVVTYNAVGVRRLGEDQYKFHFWPSDKDFGITLDPEVRYERSAGQSAWAYVGAVLTRTKMIALIDALRAMDGINCAPRDHILTALIKGYVPDEAEAAENPKFDPEAFGQTSSLDED